MPAPKPVKMRLDELLVERGLAESRTQAKALILGGKVRRGTEVLDKAGRTVPADTELTVLEPPRYVSRGAQKIAGWFAAHPADVSGWQVLDVGASTGGFTDWLLQEGAAHVTCVDVGYGQLHAKLREDPRVTNLERVNARGLQTGDLPRTDYDLVVMDLSFISLRKVLPAVWPFLRAGGTLVALVKPQFEAEKAEADKGKGIIADEAVRARILEGIRAFAREELSGSEEIGAIDSPITGTDGNHEFLLGLHKKG